MARTPAPDHAFSAIVLPEHLRLAAASSRSADYEKWLVLLTLDTTLAAAIARAREPLLAQIRLAWWREQLSAANLGVPAVDPLLQKVRREWSGETDSLAALVEGWEALAVADADDTAWVSRFAHGRAEACRGMARLLAKKGEEAGCGAAGKLWAYAEIATAYPDPEVRSEALDKGARTGATALRFSRRLRPLAVLAGLSRRALSKGGVPLLGDRLSPLVALRLGITGH